MDSRHFQSNSSAERRQLSPRIGRRNTGMNDDFAMDEILQLFLEESFEGLDLMESGLLNLDVGATDTETINDIFRAAHSIKGGAGTLGYMDVSDFTHGVETLLDEIRSGDRQTTPENVQLLLRSVDHTRAMLTCLQNNESVDATAGETLQAEISAELFTPNGSSDSRSLESTSQATPTKEECTSEPADTRYSIAFSPHLGLFKRGNDPLLMFRELRRLGELQITVLDDELPNLDQADVENCYLKFEICLITAVEEAQIRDVFEWVIDDCDLVLTGDKSGDASTTTNAPDRLALDSKSASSDSPLGTTDDTANQSTDGAAISKSKDSPQKIPAARESASIRVSTEKVDTLLNLVGELVITQSMLRRFGNEDADIKDGELRDGLLQLERHTRELQESVMQIRMLPISFCFSRFPRLVHDLSMKFGKSIELKLKGQQTEVDKTVLEKIGDPLVHLVRNSLDHGIESPEARLAAGKSETGIIELSASQEGGNIVIQVMDDGAGLNRDRILRKAQERGLIGSDEFLPDERIYNLIFAPGFSTADTVSDVSGRGVGMDVVRRNIKDLGGRVDVLSEAGKGSVFTIRLPLTLAILDGQLIRVGSETFIISLLSIVETVQVAPHQINTLPDKGTVYKMRDRYIPVVRLADYFAIDDSPSVREKGLLVVVEADGQQHGLFVDELLEQQQVVIKSLEENFRPVEGLAGATILGDGAVALILDVPGFLSYLRSQDSGPAEAA